VKELIDKIQQSRLFSSISEIQCQQFFEIFPPMIHQYQKDEIIVRRSEHFHKIGLILKGKVAVHQDTSYGTSNVITWLNELDTFAEVLMFVPSESYPTSITATTLTQVLFLESSQITQVIDSIKEVQHLLLLNITTLVAQKAFLLHNKVEILTIKSIKAKICHYLLHESEKHGQSTFKITLNRDQMASYLHVSRPSLSRELQVLQTKNIIKFKGNSFEIIDQNRCERIASEE
jgi:CRP/FNR family transcriptional regulator, dissimilatory nitrate respiration regulator